MSAVLGLSKQDRSVLLDPIVINNPIGVQVLGICSALAVTTRIDKALVMGIGVTLVVALANMAVSLAGRIVQTNIRPEDHSRLIEQALASLPDGNHNRN